MNLKTIYIKKQVKNILPGDIILHPIYRTDGLMLINKNKELLPKTIEIIKKQISENAMVLVVNNTSDFYNFVNNKVFQTDNFIEDIQEIFRIFNKYHYMQNIEIDSYMPTEYKNHSSFQEENTTNVNRLFSEIFSKMPLWNNMENVLESEYLKRRTKKIKNDFLDLLITEESFHIWLEEIRNTDNTLMIHSINVTCIALLMGLVLELNDNDLIDLCIASLFSNAGFINIKETVSKIYHSENSTSIVKKHLETFSDITSSSPYLRRTSIIYGILDSHEFYNGTGYPNKKVGQEISLYGRILHICHHYDVIINGYFSDTYLSPQQAVNAILENTEGRFDKDIVKLFIYRTNYLKLGQTYSLTNNQTGVIIGFTDYIDSPHLPIVQLENGKVVDLSIKD
ncbi:hypothetical protein GC105_08675 [Alkalibaculum sp. M08DMB]|uniref:HD-GYP domain-containing protein n=1 Tax=Alkalibaculum sporogenes TaxID=2655001 RepID=A0A6A7K8Z4_9FIRM|nr:HD domain-containing phosphohydrolase [Alkalibaculum sporogenes]MPW25862.1 hypothetical protein [Alkalibaculum sporogenes]